MPLRRRRDDAQEQVHGRADGEDSPGGGRRAGLGGGEEVPGLGADALRLAEAVRDDDCAGREAAEAPGGREWAAEETRGRAGSGDRGDEGDLPKKMVSAPARRRQVEFARRRGLSYRRVRLL